MEAFSAPRPPLLQPSEASEHASYDADAVTKGDEAKDRTLSAIEEGVEVVTNKEEKEKEEGDAYAFIDFALDAMVQSLQVGCSSHH